MIAAPILAAVTLLSVSTASRTFYVSAVSGNDAWSGTEAWWDGESGGPKSTIQAAIDAAADGDTIIVEDGTYSGVGNRDLNFKCKQLLLYSAGGPDNCIIDCEYLGSGFIFDACDTRNTWVQGFTITHGSHPDGGGIRCDGGSPTIRHCRVVANIGGGIGVDGGTPLISCCNVDNNSNLNAGAGIRLFASDAVIIASQVRGNSATGNPFTGNGGGISIVSGMPHVSTTTISANVADVSGGGLYVEDSFAIVENCLISGNLAGEGGGGVYCTVDVTLRNCNIVDNVAAARGGGLNVTTDVGAPTAVNTIFWGNDAPLGRQISVGFGSVTTSEGEASVTISFCDVAGGQAGVAADTGFDLRWGDGNLELDPLFKDQAREHLRIFSPCFNAGDPGGSYDGEADIDGQPRVFNNRVDIGADEIWITDATDVRSGGQRQGGPGNP
ncbi:MAG: hypothetical protein CHACPFDD_01321 [Phycisphaerae bacterium]|nr:hypothetical protein [Phycisphaerae bacterium]